MSLLICVAQGSSSSLSKRERSWEDTEERNIEPKKWSRRSRSMVAIPERARSKKEDLKI